MKEIDLVSVYGSLRKSMHNHHVLSDSKFIGTFDSEPIYTMYGVGNLYPAIIQGGCTSIVMEIYKVNDDIKEKLDRLEGYHEEYAPEDNYYKKVIVDTPFGSAYLYLFNNDVNSYEQIKSGDWVKYKDNKKEFNNNIYAEWD